ncbi:DinB family protein [Terriglobus albidus]|uniref:DinB family protein n=1 Tax=Terriglobus albidus TaxID=1592106 RepID=UPI0021DF9624|nr:DinB family protein [Terriglobus albidus]
MDELSIKLVIASWKQVVSRLDQRLAPLDDEQLQKQIAPDRNRLFYLLGHLTAVHDRMLPLLSIGQRLYPELDEVYIANPDRSLADPLSAADLKTAWGEVNTTLISAVEKFSADDWLKKHAAVSEEDFAKEPTRNRLAVFLSRTNHVSFHAGQVVLVK